MCVCGGAFFEIIETIYKISELAFKGTNVSLFHFFFLLTFDLKSPDSPKHCAKRSNGAWELEKKKISFF